MLVLPIWAFSGGPGRIAAAPLLDVLTQAAVQGMVAGVAGQWTFALAVKHLGSTRAALSGALVPALAALGGWIVLGERPDAPTLAGAAAIAVGILIAGVRPRAPKQPAAAPGTAPRPAAAD